MDPIEEINIQEVGTPSWMYTTPAVPDSYVPVTINLGFPVVDLPGCVEYHQDNKKDYSKTPLDRDLVNDCLLYTSPSPRDGCRSRMPSSD